MLSATFCFPSAAATSFQMHHRSKQNVGQQVSKFANSGIELTSTGQHLGHGSFFFFFNYLSSHTANVVSFTEICMMIAV